MMQKMKKTMPLFLLILCMAVLVGWGKKAVELLNDTPLIDLSKAIKESPIGNQGNTWMTEKNETESAEINPDKETESISNKDRVPSSIPQEEKKEPYRIKVRDTVITYRSRTCDTLDILKDNIIRDCSSGEGRVYLEDDYAEAHVYKEILDVLEQLHETIKLEYTFE